MFSAPLIRILFSYFGYSGYMISAVSGSGRSLLFVYLLVFGYVWFLFLRSDQINQNQKLLALLAVGSVVCQSLAPIVAVLNRLGTYFSVPMFIMLPNTANAFKMKDQRIIIIFIMMISFVFYVYFLSTESGTVPYKFMW